MNVVSNRKAITYTIVCVNEFRARKSPILSAIAAYVACDSAGNRVRSAQYGSSHVPATDIERDRERERLAQSIKRLQKIQKKKA